MTSTSSATTRSASRTGESCVERRASLANGLELCWDERGDGPPVVLIMGIGAQMVYWPEGFCDDLAAQGFRVIRFDNRDVGRSSWLHHLEVPSVGGAILSALVGTRPRAPYSLEDMADDVAYLLDALGIDSAHVVGASMGGMIAQTLAFTHPHRVRSLVSMMSTTGKPGVLISDPRALRALLGSAPRTKEEAVAANLAFHRAVRGPGFEPDERSVIERASLAWDRGSNPRGFLRQLGAIATTGDRTARLRFVRAPTLVLHGTHDPLIRPIGGRLTAEAIPRAHLRWIEGMGHDFPRGSWPLVCEAIASLARRTDAA